MDHGFRVLVLSSEETLYDGEVIMAECNTREGWMGIYKGHVPMTMVVEEGMIRLTTAEGVREFEAKNGIAHIRSDVVRFFL